MNFDNNELAAISPELALGSRDTEAAVLSVLITFPAVFDDVSDRIKPAFFSDELYRAIFVEVCRQMAAGKGCDVVTLAESSNRQLITESLSAAAVVRMPAFVQLVPV